MREILENTITHSSQLPDFSKLSTGDEILIKSLDDNKLSLGMAPMLKGFDCNPRRHKDGTKLTIEVPEKGKLGALWSMLAIHLKYNVMLTFLPTQRTGIDSLLRE
jgi:hypothetical protein